MKEINHLDLFAGMGGFALALRDAGFKVKKHWFSEIDKHAIANYKYNFPDAEYIGSINDISGDGINPDIITFGWPCQDNSIAGKRKGQRAGTRSGLLFEAVRLVDKCRPRNFIAENVKGLSSVNEGCDFYEALEVLSFLNSNLPQYDIEMQLLNTSWVLPQNRERFYFIGHLRNRSVKRIFPVGKDDCRADERTGNAATVRTITGGGAQRRPSQLNDLTACVNDRGTIRETVNANCIDANYHKGTDNHGARTMIKIKSNTIGGGGQIANIGDSINFSMPNSKTRRGRVGKGIAQTLDTQSNQAVVVQTLSGSDTLNTIRNGGRGSLTDKHSLDIIQQVSEMKIANCVTPDAYLARGERNRDDDGKAVLTSMADRRIRRLTEVECERLQGYPDDWTKYGIYERQVWINKKEGTFKIVEGIREIPKTQRYKLCGNAVTKLIPEIIARKLFDNF